MSQMRPLLAPAKDGTEIATYVAHPRAKRHFNTLLDAGQIFDPTRRSQVTTTIGGEGAARRVEIKTEHPLREGRISETLELSATGHLRSLRLHRTLFDQDGTATREEKIEFTRGPIRLPEATYPEVMLPFVLRWQPVDSERRSLVAWIVDRFIARVYCEWKGKSKLTVPAGTLETVEMMMYPDLNDWVSLGNVINTLAKPLLPKYRMWFEVAPPHRVVRFEGPYGPPGAPEIVLELSGTS
jgi:hypothetical protein